MHTLSIASIGVLKSCFKEKFGTPRQAGLIPSATGILKLNRNAHYNDALRHLEGFSHVWIIYHFHDLADSTWKPLITPPRIDAPGRVGVFASRSPHRPNGLGMSALKLERIDFEAKDGIEIHLSGVDILDNTPVYDLKPYVPYVDCIPNARPGWTESKIPKYGVEFSNQSLIQIEDYQNFCGLKFSVLNLIRETMEYDPRPTSQRASMPLSDEKNEGLAFAFRILDLDIHWRIRGCGLFVERIDSVPANLKACLPK